MNTAPFTMMVLKELFRILGPYLTIMVTCEEYHGKI